jgi:alpha-L-glutamate ligase-like protein
MLGTLRALRRSGILGVNARNARYILPHNRRECYPAVDDKVRTKSLASAAGLAVPELYGVIETNHGIRKLDAILRGHNDFVVKPAHGSGGDGIVVVVDSLVDRYRLASGELMMREDLTYHIHTLLAGIFSLGGQPDTAMIEYRIRFDPLFERVTYQGVPDIRIVTFLGIPAMAMVRLPTRQSRGRANLHQGAIGVGVDMAAGKTLSGVWNSRIVTEHPDSGEDVVGLQIPDWDDMLMLAARSQALTGLSYQGVDIALDEKLGPLILELNARPGLAIQIANQSGLGPRLRQIEAKAAELKDDDTRIAFAKERFGLI